MEPGDFNETPLDAGRMRLENELMKLRLQAEYGAIFPDAKTTEADPEPEYIFLKRVLALHQRLAGTPPRPLREVLDFDRFPPANAFTDAQSLNSALWDVLDYLEDENVIVSFDHSYPDRVMYEFVTEELPELEVIGKPAQDEFICIVYEAFHPNLQAEAEDFADEFFEALLGGDIQLYPALYFRKHRLPTRLLHDTEEELRNLIEQFLDCFDISSWHMRIRELRIEPRAEAGNKELARALLSGDLNYTAVLSDGTTHAINGAFSLELEQSLKQWYVVDFRLPGFIWPAKGAERP